MTLISVIIPVYNGEKTIKATIESVLQQTHYDLEIIVINSSSNDATLDILSNASVNRNRGLAHANAEFVTFLDADDIWTSDKLEAQYNALQENPQAAVAYSFTNAIDENNQFLRKCSHATWNGNVYSNLLLDDFIGSGSNVMVRKYAFSKIGGFDESLTNAEDTDMWLRLAAQYHFVSVKKVQILYRISTNSKSSNILGAEQSNLKIIERVFSDLPNNLQYLKKYRIANLYKYLSYKALTAYPGKQNSLQVLRLLWQTVKTDPIILQKFIIYKAMLKLIIMMLLPPQVAIICLKKFSRISDVSTFFGYIKTNIQ
jgi:glycosyltransferase involved in cell wall biosynthesis